MPYTPTSWDDLGDDLQSLFKEVTCFSESSVSVILREAIQQAMLNPAPAKDTFIRRCIKLGIDESEKPLIECCWNFVDYQLNEPNMCNRDKKLFADEGFQIGSPWHGNILNAPVLFLSFNPAVTQNCLFPRWHIRNNTFTLAGINTPAKRCSDVYEFFRDRLTNAYIDHTGAPNAKYTDGTNFPVSYWRGMYKTMNILAGISMNGSNIADHCRRLMRSVLSAEIIFWGSKDSKHAKDPEHLRYFWEKFTVPMLNKCGAKAIILTGGPAHDVFRSIILPNGGIYTPKHYANRKGQEFMIAAVNHISTDTYKNYDKAAQYIHNKRPDIVDAVHSLYYA